MNQRQIVYISIWLIVSFAAVIGATQLFATIFNSSAVQMLGQGIAFLTLLVTGTVAILNQTSTARTGDNGDDTDDHTPEENEDADTGADTTTDSSGSDVEPASQAHSFSDTDDTHEPLNRTGLRRSNDDILKEVGDTLSDRLTFYDNGVIEIDDDDLNLYSQMLLYVIAKRLAYEDQFVDTPQVTGDELHERFDYTMVDIMLFLEETGIRLDSRRSFSVETGALDYAELGDAAFTAGINSLPSLVDWVFEDRHVTQFDMSSALNRAIASLSAARRYYDQASKPADSAGRSMTQNHKRLSQEIVTACNDIKQYPAVIGYDNHWKTFVRYTEALLNYIDNDVYGQTEHCLPRMKRAVEHMQETVGSPFD